MNFNQSLALVQSRNEDHEWYPTTTEILDQLVKSIKKDCHRSNRDSFLDIGAGNGKVIDYARSKFSGKHTDDLYISRFYAIEKSQTLQKTLVPEIFILGCDFWQTTLIDKDVDIVFSNPPYSCFEDWTVKIIREVPCTSIVYLVLPEQWSTSNVIQIALKTRCMEAKNIGEFQFAMSEDRKARGTVNLIQIQGCKIPATKRQWRHDNEDIEETDPFEQFFNETFTMPEPVKEKPWEEKLNNTQVSKRLNFIEALCLLYQERMDELNRNYQAVCAIDPTILVEFQISKAGLVESLRMKLKACKKEYWERLFSGMQDITNRLTEASRKTMLELMQSQTGIDFNRDNCYAVVMWVVKNANTYFDRQFIDTYEKLIEFANVEAYKSNKKVFGQHMFRYNWSVYKTADHFRLKVGHRIVLERCGGLYTKSNYSWKKGLSERAANLLCDLLVIADNMGYQLSWHEKPCECLWDGSQAVNYNFFNKEIPETLFEVRAFMNQNMHLRINPDFIHAMNVRHGKLKGWINSFEEAAKELEIPQTTAFRHFNNDEFRIEMSSLPMLTNSNQ
jgi:hypothetical protein